MAKTLKASSTRVRKSRKSVDAKSAAANDTSILAQAADLASAVVAKEVAEAPKVAVQPLAKEVVVRKGDSAVQKGAKYAVMAGRPSKQAVTLCFGKRGYSLSWIQRAEEMKTSPEALCARFKADPAELKIDWELAHPIILKGEAPKDEIAKGVTVTSARKVVDPLATATPVAE